MKITNRHVGWIILLSFITYCIFTADFDRTNIQAAVLIVILVCFVISLLFLVIALLIGDIEFSFTIPLPNLFKKRIKSDFDKDHPH